MSTRHAGLVADLGLAGARWWSANLDRASPRFGHVGLALGDVEWLSRVPGGHGIAGALLRPTPVPGRRNDQIRRLHSIAAAALTQLDEDLPAEILETAALVMARALLDGDRQRASGLIERAMAAGQSYGEAAVSMVQPAMYLVGSLWQQNLVTVAQEHLATGVARTVLTKAFVRAAFAPEIERRVLLACVPGNRHGLGARIVADCFEIAGWEVECLGADVPESTLLTRIRSWRPDLVGLSIAQVAQIAPARAIIAAIRREFGPTGPRIVVGGLATNQLADAAAALGADAWRHDALTALETPLG